MLIEGKLTTKLCDVKSGPQPWPLLLLDVPFREEPGSSNDCRDAVAEG